MDHKTANRSNLDKTSIRRFVIQFLILDTEWGKKIRSKKFNKTLLKRWMSMRNILIFEFSLLTNVKIGTTTFT